VLTENITLIWEGTIIWSMGLIQYNSAPLW